MSDRRDPQRKLISDAARYKRERNAAKALVDRMLPVMIELQDELVKTRVREWLRHPEDFDTFIGLDAVVASDGRIDERQLELRLRDLLSKRPELGLQEERLAE